ncbi:uncharacterized protein LOC117114233 [Anneissia japonica]|uniref:uncharacterized protein LOC117114233 n=1 Tax=Anneissia japonica TaxID=1529436 RepID=UPI001425B2E1|nr:uncharacterized protein LOC117114233 [Anneissia japonica]
MTTMKINAKVIFQGFVVQQNLPLAANDHFSKLVGRMFPGSEIAQKYSCGRTKGTHIVCMLALELISQIKREVAETAMYLLATDRRSSDEEDTFFPVLITHEDKTTGLITTSLLDMPMENEASGKTLQMP